ncbi:unnamed protein product [Ectocarpus sp. 12 AP-2014]
MLSTTGATFDVRSCWLPCLPVVVCRYTMCMNVFAATEPTVAAAPGYCCGHIMPSIPGGNKLNHKRNQHFKLLHYASPSPQAREQGPGAGKNKQPNDWFCL